MKLAAVHLELAHEGYEQAPIQLLSVPTSSSARPARVPVDLLKLLESFHTVYIPDNLCARHNGAL